MSFFTNIRADRFITELKEAKDVAAPATQKAIAKLRELGPGAIEPVTAALADADKIATVAFIEVLTGLVTQKTFPKFIEAMVQGSPRVIAGVAWALSSSRAYPPTMLLEALSTDGIAKSALLDVITAHRSRLSVREILADIEDDDKRAAEVIRRLRDMLRKGDVHNVELDVDVLVREVVKLLRSDTVIRDVTVTLDLRTSPTMVIGDRVQLQQVVLNLVLNAMEAMAECRRHERNLVLSHRRSI